jgi:hypothetical protein
LDWFDLLIHAGITAAATGLLARFVGPPDEGAAVATVIAVSLGLLAWRRHWALKRRDLTGDPGTTERLEELEARMADFDRVQARLLELEERLDFAERVLVQHREAGRLSGGLETR